MNHDNEKTVGKDHIFWEYFDTAKGGIGNHDAAAFVYGGELIYAGLLEMKESIDDVRAALSAINVTLRAIYDHGAYPTIQGDGANPELPDSRQRRDDGHH